MTERLADGPRIGISGAIPSKAELEKHGGNELNTRIAVIEIAKRLLEAGANLIHGSHPTFRVLIKDLVVPDYHPGDPKSVRMFASRFFVLTQEELAKLPEEERGGLETEPDVRAEHEPYAIVELTDAPAGDRSPQAQQRALTTMREALIPACEALVCIGGRLADEVRIVPGVRQEFEIARDRGMPIYLIGTGGGATRMLYDELGNDPTPLNNGLDEKDNSDLATGGADPWRAARLIEKGLRERGILGDGAHRGALPAPAATLAAPPVPLAPAGPAEAAVPAEPKAEPRSQPEADRPPRRLRALSLDGGGILGAFTAGVLAGLMDRAGKEEAIRARAEGREPSKLRLLDHVDLITGTSTGGILAIALGMGKSPDEVSEFYRTSGPKIFPKDAFGFRALRQLLKYKYDPAPLRKAIEDVVGIRPLREAGCALVIPAIDANAGNIRLLKTDHHVEPQWDFSELPAVDVALATAAAPTYFPAHTIRGKGTFVDGGLWANCPTMVALTEAVAYLGYDLAEVKLLSISTTSVPYYISSASRLGGILRWAKPVIEALMRFQAEGSWASAKSLLTRRGGVFHRIDHVAPDKIFSMDKVAMVENLIGLGWNVGGYDQHYSVFRDHFLSGPPATLHRG